MGVDYLQLVNEITAPMPPMPVARLGEPPWTPLERPLSESRVMLVSSAGVHRRDEEPFRFVNDLSYRLISADADPESLRPCHPSPIRRPGRIDINVVHPYQRLAELVDAGIVGEATASHLSILGAIKLLVPLVSELGPQMAAEAKNAEANVVALIPLCPACHQTIALLARVLEGEGLTTVTLTGARSITERIRPPRGAYLDYPLGYCVGRPNEPSEQRAILLDVLRLAELEQHPGTIVDLAHRWPDEGWEDAIVKQYAHEREVVAGQRSHEFSADGRHLAQEQVAAVEALFSKDPGDESPPPTASHHP